MSNAKPASVPNAQGANDEVTTPPTGRFHAWRASGGKLVPLKTRRSKSPTLYPFLLTGKLTHESEGAKAYVFFTLVVAVLVVVLWVQWLNAKMGGGRPRAVPASPAVSLSGGVEIPVTRATPYHLGLETTTPTLTRTPAPVEMPVTAARTPTMLPTPVPVVTVTPTPTPTPAGERVQVILSSYWPDDGPDWCLTWDEEGEQCISPLTSGDDFRLFAGRAFACDPEWLGHTLVIPALQMVYPCLDTGISFVCEGGPCTVGLLSRQSKEVMGIYEGTLR
jgi:hypothetical protein